MKKFRHLNVPSHWEHYWSKYPEGYTILESLLNWVRQVDDMVDNVNDWNKYLEEFVETFDKKLKPHVIAFLSEMEADGRLSEIINDEILQNKADRADLKILEDDVASQRLNVMYPPPPFATPAGDGVTDVTAILNSLGKLAFDTGVTLFIPNYEYKVEGALELYGNTEIQGTFIMDKGDNSVIKIKRKKTPYTIPGANLSGLTRHSSKLFGVSTPGTLLLESTTEAIIDRSMGGHYLKGEVSRVVDTNGTISPPLDHTYKTLDTLTGTLFPDEETIVINNLKIKMVGSVFSERDHVVGVERSDVVFNHPNIDGGEDSDLKQAMRFQNSMGIIINKPKIRGFENLLSGYGIALYNSGDIQINDGDIHECRHCISGTKNKKVRVNGGDYSSNISATIDSHWGMDFVVDGVTSTIPNSAVNHVVYAGSDIEVVNSNFYGGVNVFGIRNDTPELRGNLKLDNIKWVTFADTVRLCGFTTSTLQDHQFMRTLLNPWNTHIKDINIHAPATTTVNVLYTASRQYDQFHWGDIEIENIKAIGVETLRVFTGEKYNEYFKDSNPTHLNIRNIERGTPDSQGVLINDRSEGEDVNKGYDVYIDGYEGLYWSVAQSAAVNAKIKNSTIHHMRWATPTQGFIGDYVVEGSTFDNTTFSGYMLMDFINCTFEGTIISNNTAIDQRVKSSFGNRAKIGTTGHPTNLDGYVNPRDYIV